ncbi:MAG: PEP-CTERM sorting domain-containing protein [Planctomycetes bacterium]|nr:PEP-CTERM sorting domain-containing protein [Planctomycetota bacterium]
MRSTLSVCALVLAVAASADAALTAIYRTNTNNDVADSYGTYNNLYSLGSHSSGGNTSISPSLSSMRHTYIFGDFVGGQTADPYMYRTVLNSSNQITQIIRYAAPTSDPMANLRTNTGGQVFNLSQAWNWEDDFYHDGTAFYRNATGSSSNFGVTRYATFMDLVNNTNGTFYNYGANYGFNDRFFGFEGKIYRTNTGGPGGSVNGFAVYNSFNDLLSGNVAQTISSVNYSAGDLYIAVPAPGAMVLLGVAGLVGARRRK